MWLVKDSGVPEGSKLSLTLGLSHFCRIAAVPRPLRLQVTTSRQTERTEFALSFGFRSCSPAPHDDRSGAVSLVPLGACSGGRIAQFVATNSQRRSRKRQCRPAFRAQYSVGWNYSPPITVTRKGFATYTAFN